MELLFIFAMLELACFSFCRAFARIFLFAMLLHAFLFMPFWLFPFFFKSSTNQLSLLLFLEDKDNFLETFWVDARFGVNLLHFIFDFHSDNR